MGRQLHAPAALPTEKAHPAPIGVWVGTRAGMDALEKTNSLPLPRIEQRFPDHQALSLVTTSTELYRLDVKINMGYKKKKQRNFVLC
jgi:hypothetical protein